MAKLMRPSDCLSSDGAVLRAGPTLGTRIFRDSWFFSNQLYSDLGIDAPKMLGHEQKNLGVVDSVFFC